jgi:hypothetical protein
MPDGALHDPALKGLSVEWFTARGPVFRVQ